MASLQPFLPELVELLTTSILSGSSTSTMKLVKGAASGLFNLSRLSLEESVAPSDDEIISTLVALVESLRMLLEKDVQEGKDLQRLLVVCIGGFIVLGKDTDTIKQVLGGVDAVEVIQKVAGAVSQEVADMSKPT